jgi:hypothetical protein
MPPLSSAKTYGFESGQVDVRRVVRLRFRQDGSLTAFKSLLLKPRIGTDCVKESARNRGLAKVAVSVANESFPKNRVNAVLKGWVVLALRRIGLPGSNGAHATTRLLSEHRLARQTEYQD